jgi:predicted transposase YbfD/YdcC
MLFNIDAIGTQTEIAQKTIHRQADYVLALPLLSKLS